MLEWHQVILALSIRVACCSPTVIIILLLYVQSINSELCYHKSVNEIIAISLFCCLSSVYVYPCPFYQAKKKKKNRGKKLNFLHWFLWWHISVITCQIIMLICQIFMSSCQIIMLTCQIFMSSCQIFMLTCQIFMLTCHLLCRLVRYWCWLVR